MQDDGSEDAVISFDGDLDRIQQLALEEAIRKKNAAGKSESPTLSPAPSTMELSDAPSLVPTTAPSASLVPSPAPSESSMIPSFAPSDSDAPSTAPSMVPSSTPSHSAMPSDEPSIVPSSAPSHSSMPSDAPSIVPSQQPSPSTELRATATSTPTLAPTTDSDPLDSSTIIACPDIEDSNEYIVTWQYSVETVPIFDAQLIVDRVEARLANEMVPLLLNCWDPSVFFDFNLQGIDQQPQDTPSETGTLHHYVCLLYVGVEFVVEHSKPYMTSLHAFLFLSLTHSVPSYVFLIDECVSETEGLTCTVFNGEMRLYMPESENANYVFYQARTAIKSILDSPRFHDNVIGLLKSTYLGPAIVIPTSFNDGDSIKGNQPKDQGTLGVTSLVLVAVGSAALIVFVGSVYYMRRDNTTSEAGIDGNATQAAGSSVNDYSFPFVSPRARTPSPFSAMVPNAYQFNENMSILSGGMSILSGNAEGLEAVLEQSDEEAQSAQSVRSPREAPSPAHSYTSSILVSESGYTTEAAEDDDDLDTSLSFDVPRSLYAKTPESPDRLLMGARRRKESHVTANASILNTSTLSDGEMHDEAMLVWTPSKSAVFSEDEESDDDYTEDLLNLV
jgi:hypothetical protein